MSTQTAQQKIKSAMAVIANHYDFFGPAILSLNWKPDASVPTACTDGHDVLYNEAFVSSLAPEEVVGLILHETLHPMLGHLHRIKGMDLGLANIAFDYEINNFIESYNQHAAFPVRLPTGALRDLAKYRNLAGEVVYSMLVDDQQNQQNQQQPQGGGDKDGDQDVDQDGDQDGKNGNGSGQNGKQGGNGSGNSKSGRTPTPGEFKPAPGGGAGTAETRDKWQEVMATCVQTAKLRGSLPGEFLRKLSGIDEAPVKLAEILRNFMSDISFDGDSNRPDRAWLANHDVFVRGIESERHGTLVFVLDTSGSMSSKTLMECVSVIQESVNTLNASRLVVLDVDTDVADVREFLPNEPVPVSCKGGGGTDFRPAFDWTRKNCPDARALVYLTDGEGVFPSSTPDVPVVWVSFGLPANAFPFGRVVALADA